MCIFYGSLATFPCASFRLFISSVPLSSVGLGKHMLACKSYSPALWMLCSAGRRRSPALSWPLLKFRLICRRCCAGTKKNGVVMCRLFGVRLWRRVSSLSANVSFSPKFRDFPVKIACKPSNGSAQMHPELVWSSSSFRLWRRLGRVRPWIFHRHKFRHRELWAVSESHCRSKENLLDLC